MHEVFGSPDQQRMQIKGEQLMHLLSGDIRFCSHGRGVQVTDYTEESADLLEAVVRLIGASGCEMVPKLVADQFSDNLQKMGLKVDVMGNFIGGPSAIDVASNVLKAKPLPNDLTVKIVDQDSPGAWLEGYAEVAVPHGVLPPIGAVLRGISRPGFAMIAFDEDERPIATAGAVSARHIDHPDSEMVQWGQLATAPNRQGEGIARALGAMAILHASEHLNARRFSTGIRAGNNPSKRLCNALGVFESDYVMVLGMDPTEFSDGRLTK